MAALAIHFCCIPCIFLFCIPCSGLQLRRSQARQPTSRRASRVTTPEPTPSRPPGAPPGVGRATSITTPGPTSATPRGAALSLGDATSITTAQHHLREPPLRPPIWHPLASSRNISSGHDRYTLREDDTHGSGEHAIRPSGSGARFYPPELPPPELLSPPHRPPEVEQPSPHRYPTITNPSRAESQCGGLFSDLNNNTINRRDDQPVREYSLTTFLSPMGLDFPDPDLKTLIRTNQRTN